MNNIQDIIDFYYNGCYLNVKEIIINFRIKEDEKKIKDLIDWIKDEVVTDFKNSLLNYLVRKYKIDYKEYLLSDHWVEFSFYIKNKINSCQLCSSKTKLQLHHNNYDCLYNEKESDVVVLCKKCHEKFHNIRKGK